MTISASFYTELPCFSQIVIQEIVPMITKTLAESKQKVEQLVNQKEPFTWDNLCQPLSEQNEYFNKLWSPISHLNAVKNSSALREAYEQCLPLLAEYSTWIGQHKGLYQAYQQIKQSDAFTALSQSQRKAIENTLRNFELSGISLPANQQQRYGKIVKRLSELSSYFSNNVLDATMGWSKLITDVDQLKGLPESALLAAKALAESKNQQGWLLTLDMPSYLPVMTYCDSRELRCEIYQAYTTRASDQGPNAGKWDNSKIMNEILMLRHELANLLGFKTYADKSLATKMAENPQQVIDFISDLSKRAHKKGIMELQQLTDFAQQHMNFAGLLEPWDITYYSEKQKHHLYKVNDEQLRPYFPEQRVLHGLFTVLQKIFGMSVRESTGIDTWHPEVRYFEIYDQQQQLRGSFYLDLYAREHKRGGAWMDGCASRLKFADGRIQTPVAYLTCNFSRPLGDKPALFTHNEVITLFHEFGHGLHHMLTQIDVEDVAGINGVPWDAVELPSQFLENWCWEIEALSFISGHYETNEPLPKEILDKLLAAKNYQAALFILRQLEFGLFDFRLHYEFDPKQGAQVLPMLYAVKADVAVIPSPPWTRFPHSFGHIFAGGYAAGYYSYLWAEVLSADAFSRFEQEGIFNPNTGQAFLENILSKGGSEEPMVMFKHFMGREPKLDALLTQYGIED